MVSEKICLDIVRSLYGRVVTATQKYLPGTPEETIRENKTKNALGEAELYRPLLSLYQLNAIDDAIRWLELGGYLSKTWPMGKLFSYLHVLTEKGCAVAEKGAFDPSERKAFYLDEPYAVFLASQFNDNDQEIVHFIKEQLLEPKGFTVQQGHSDGLEEFRHCILAKIRNSRFFVCLLTKRDMLQSGNFASSVWLYQEIGAAIALDKKPLILVEEGIDDHFAGEMQKTYEYIDFSRSNYREAFAAIPQRLKNDLEANLIPPPGPNTTNS